MSEVKDIIKMLKFHINRANNVYDGFDLEDCKLAEDAIKIIEKQIPKKPIRKSWSITKCPLCNGDLGEYLEDGYTKDYDNLKVCDCGQKLDWSETSET